MGNSDHSTPRSKDPAISLTAAAPLWHAFVRDVTTKTPIAQFSRPKNIVKARIDAWSGGKPGPWTRDTISELFIKGTQPGAKKAVDPPGLLYSRSCGGWRVDPLKAELGPRGWNGDVADWLRRARRGPGVIGPLDSRTAYFWGKRGWGGPLIGSCVRPKVEHHDKDNDKKEKPPGKDPPGPPGGPPGHGDPSPTPKP
jgi:hypothetical protein